jgi:putative phage-type endonuclease
LNVIDTSGMTRPEWLKLRTQSIGGSDTGKIAGFQPSRFGLYLEKLGDAPSFEPNEQMWFGTELEPVILRRLFASGALDPDVETATQVMIRHEHYPWMTATLDMVRADSDVWEFKACGIQSAKRLEDGNSTTLPESWVLQAHHQMMCAGVGQVNFAVFVGHRLAMYRFALEWDDAIGQGLLQLEKEFWRHVEDRIPPAEFDPSDAALLLKHYRTIEGETIHATENSKIHMLAEKYEVASSAAKFQAELADQLKAALLAEMKTAPRLIVGPYRMSRSTINVKAQEPKPRAAHSYTKFTFTNKESDE